MASTSTPRGKTRAGMASTTMPANSSPHNSSPEREMSAFLLADSPISAADMLVRARRRKSGAAANSSRAGPSSARYGELSMLQGMASTPHRPKTGPSAASLLSSPEREAAVRASLISAAQDHDGLELSRTLQLSPEPQSMGPPATTPRSSTPAAARQTQAIVRAPETFLGTPFKSNTGSETIRTPLPNRSNMSLLRQNHRRHRSHSTDSSASAASSTSSASAAMARQRQKAFAAWGGAREESPMDLLRRLANAPGFLPTPEISLRRAGRRDTGQASLGPEHSIAPGSASVAGRADVARRSNTTSMPRKSVGGSTTLATSEVGQARRAARYSLPHNPFAHFAQTSGLDADETLKATNLESLRLSLARESRENLVESMGTHFNDSGMASLESVSALQEDGQLDSGRREEELANILAVDSLLDETDTTRRSARIDTSADSNRSQDIDRQRTLTEDEDITSPTRESLLPADESAAADFSYGTNLSLPDGSLATPDRPIEFNEPVDDYAFDDGAYETGDNSRPVDQNEASPQNSVISGRGQEAASAQGVTHKSGRLSSESLRLKRKVQIPSEEIDDDADKDDESMDALTRKDLNAARLALLRKRRIRKRQQRIAPLTGQAIPPLPSSLVRELFCAFATPSVGLGLAGSVVGGTNGPGVGKQRIAKAKVERSALEAVEDLSHHFFAQFARDLVLQAEHKPTPSTRITEADIVALLRAQGHISSRHSLVSLARKYLPRELSDLVVAGGEQGTDVASGRRRKRKSSDVVASAQSPPSGIQKQTGSDAGARDLSYADGESDSDQED